MKCGGIYEEKAVEEVFFLRLTDDGNGDYTLKAVDIHGDTIVGGFILNVGRKGVLRITSVNDKLGIALDDEGRIAVDRTSD